MRVRVRVRVRVGVLGLGCLRGQVGGDGRVARALGVLQRGAMPPVERRVLRARTLDKEGGHSEEALGGRQVEGRPPVVVAKVDVVASVGGDEQLEPRLG